MATKIKIGADELILWLRKNKKAEGLANDVLGKKIYYLITELEGVKLPEREAVHWSNFVNDKNVGRYDLPKSAAQYEIDSLRLGELFVELNKL